MSKKICHICNNTGYPVPPYTRYQSSYNSDGTCVCNCLSSRSKRNYNKNCYQCNGTGIPVQPYSRYGISYNNDGSCSRCSG
jgi:hypothetical protein